MSISGTITQASQASPPSGQFNVRYQDITIIDQAGKEWYGRIGSKQGYQEGTPIIVAVEIKNDQDGTPYNYFKKFNPQYGDPPAATQGQRPISRDAPQAPPAGAGQARAPVGGVGQPRGNKDKLIVTQVVYKVLGGCFQDPNDFDLWLTKNLPVLKRHTQLLLMVGEEKDNPAPAAEQIGNPNPDYDPDYVPPNDSIPF